MNPYTETNSPLSQLRKQSPLITIIFFISWGILFLISMHYFNFNSGGSGLQLPFNNTTWAAASLVIAIGFYAIAHNRSVAYTTFTTQLLICFIILTIPLLYPQANQQEADLRFLGLWAGFSLFLGLHQFSFNRNQVKLLLYIVLAGLSMELLLAWSQYLFFPAKNWMAYNIKSLRPAGIFQQPNVAGSAFAMILALSAYLLSSCKNFWLRIWLLITPIITVPMIIILVSRTGWLATILILLLLLPQLRKQKGSNLENSLLLKKNNSVQNHKLFYLWYLSVFIGSLIALLFIFAPDLFPSSTRFGSVIASKTVTSDLGRKVIYTQSIELWLRHFWTGVGYGNFEFALIHDLAPLYHEGLMSAPPYENLTHPHNEFLYWAAEGGIVSVIGVLFAVYILIRKIIQFKGREMLLMLALFVPIGLHLQTEYPLYHSSIHWIILITLLYLLDWDAINAKQTELNTSSTKVLSIPNTPITAEFSFIIKIFSILIPLIIIPSMYIVLRANNYLMYYEMSKMDTSYLNKAINLVPKNNYFSPADLVKYRFDWDLYGSEIFVGLQLNRKDQIKSFIQWAEENESYGKKSKYYYWLYSAYKGLGELKKAQQIWNKGHYLFPNSRYFISENKLIVKPEQSDSEKAVSHTETTDDLIDALMKKVQQQAKKTENNLIQKRSDQ